MAWSGSVLSSTLRALMAADKPVLVGGSYVAAAATLTRWNATGSWATADASATTGPARYGGDYYEHLFTSPNTTGTTWYYLLDFGANVTFDAAAILHHNFGTVGGLTVTLEVADNNTFATNLATLATWSPGSSSKRLVSLSLKDSGSDAKSISAQCVRIKMTKGSAFTPSIGEVIIRARRQLSANPDVPWDDMEMVSRGTTHESSDGVESTYMHHAGRRRIEAVLRPYETSYQDDLRNFWLSDIAGGVAPFLWIDKPATDPQGAYWMKQRPLELKFPWLGPAQRELRLVAYEQGTQFVSMES
jgi:hypothetical protein